MIFDARSLTEGTTIETDICIVGAGTSGLVLAKEFLGAKFKVCLLESGGLLPDKETQGLYRGVNIGRPYFSLDTARARYFGGSTNRWHIPVDGSCVAARMHPFSKLDFEKRDWVPYSGWPVSKSDMESYYERAQHLCHIAPSSYSPDYWAKQENAGLLPLPSSIVETQIYKFGSRYPFIKGIRSDIEKADNITTYLYSNAIDIETNEYASHVSRIRVACLQGNKFYVKAKYFILAAGAIEIPRLLLLSNQTQKKGLGNQNDLVGRFFMEHPHLWSGLFIPFNQDNLAIMDLYSHVRVVQEVPIVAKLSLSDKIQREEKLLNYSAQFMPQIILRSSLNQYTYPEIKTKGVSSFKKLRSSICQKKLPGDFFHHALNMLIDITGIAKASYRNAAIKAMNILDKKRLTVFQIANMSEQAPNPDSRITLSSNLDALGQNQVELNWQWNSNDLDSIIRSQKILDTELQRANLGRLIIQVTKNASYDTIKGGWHHMGTTRMHSNPKQGVVDKDCCVHGISNLFISGPSVFTTGGVANPSLSLVAFSIRLADHIKKISE